MSGWWRRNRRAVIAVIILLPLTAGVAGGWEWWKRSQGRPTFAVVAPAGGTVDFGGITFGPATAQEIAVPDVDLPEDSTIIAVDVEIDRHGATTACSTPVLRELGGEGRLWEADMSKVGWDSDYDTLCPSDPRQESFPRGPFSIDVPFVIPDDVVGDLGVEFLVVDELPSYVRLVVSP